MAPDSLVTFTNAENGLTYGALRYTDRETAGQTMVQRARCLSAVANFSGDFEATTNNPFVECPAYRDIPAPQRPSTRLPAPATARFELGQYVDLFEILADMSFIMEYGNPYDP